MPKMQKASLISIFLTNLISHAMAPEAAVQITVPFNEQLFLAENTSLWQQYLQEREAKFNELDKKVEELAAMRSSANPQYNPASDPDLAQLDASIANYNTALDDLIEHRTQFLKNPDPNFIAFSETANATITKEINAIQGLLSQLGSTPQQ